MFVQTEQTPNPNTMKFLPGKKVSEVGSLEFTDQKQSENKLIKGLLSLKEVNTVFLGPDFITVTGIASPFSLYMVDIPNFFTIIPLIDIISFSY